MSSNNATTTTAPKQKTKKVYIVSPVTRYDDDNLLFYTHISVEGRDKPLLFSAWGLTESESRNRAEKFVATKNK